MSTSLPVSCISEHVGWDSPQGSPDLLVNSNLQIENTFFVLVRGSVTASSGTHSSLQMVVPMPGLSPDAIPTPQAHRLSYLPLFLTSKDKPPQPILPFHFYLLSQF